MTRYMLTTAVEVWLHDRRIFVPSGYVLTLIDERKDVVRVAHGRFAWNMSHEMLVAATQRRDTA